MPFHKLARQYISGDTFHQHGRAYLYPVSTENLLQTCEKLYTNHDLPLKLISAVDERATTGKFRIFYVFGVPKENIFIVPYIDVKEDFPSIASTIQQASAYERKIKTFFGLNPVGHTHPQMILLHENWPEDAFPLRKEFHWNTRPPLAKGAPYIFEKVHGEGVYEIPVGPVHAGIIEPGHFRFHVMGEQILFLEAKLGFKHRGVEKLFETLPFENTVRLSERVSGDSSFSHSLAYCQAIEAIASIEVPGRDALLRIIFAELERIANHIGDIGFILQDTGFSFGGSNGGRLREMIMQWHERLTGNRYMRGVNTFGGVKKDISPEIGSELKKALHRIRKDFADVIKISKNSDSVMNRLRNTGILDPQIAKDHSVLGVPARALGFPIDARKDFPYSSYNDLDFNISLEKDGDVYSRFSVRVEEINSSIRIITSALEKLKVFELKKHDEAKKIKLPANSYGIGIVEGWRGDIVYFIATDGEGKLNRVEVRDPSFMNWTAVGYAGPGNIVPDFPLINKSFNLSYSGNDL